MEYSFKRRFSDFIAMLLVSTLSLFLLLYIGIGEAQRTYEQLQALRPYYQFSQIDIDRYEIDGEIRQVMLAGRQIDDG